MLDEKDKLILDLLKNNSALTSSQISKKTRIPITTIHNRIKRMKQNGIIKNFSINIDYEKIGKSLTSYILLTVNQNLSQGKKTTQQEIGKKILSLPDIENVDIVTGSTDMFIKIRTDSMKSLNNLLTMELRKINGVDKTQTMMVLEEL